MSRQELVQWVNELLATEISKVEECGKGAIYCQILDSIYGDVPMSKVKFNVKAEYEFLNNYKVLQGVFNRHKIDRQIPVEKLVKCRFQDNLEFLQYCKKHWDANWSGQEYDAVGRRAGRVATVAGPPSAASGRTSVQSQTSGRSSVVRSRPVGQAGGAGASGRASVSGVGAPGVGGVGAAPRRTMGNATMGTSPALTKAQQQIATLEADAVEYQQVLEGLETERNFYFNKLREIEVLVQENAEQMDQVQVEGMIREIQTILYSTEEGFQVPEEEEVF